jgi:hypothetical protein
MKRRTGHAVALNKRYGKVDKVKCAKALTDLLDFVVSGRRYETRNPYSIPEVNAAFEALGRDWRNE